MRSRCALGEAIATRPRFHDRCDAPRRVLECSSSPLAANSIVVTCRRLDHSLPLQSFSPLGPDHPGQSQNDTARARAQFEISTGTSSRRPITHSNHFPPINRCRGTSTCPKTLDDIAVRASPRAPRLHGKAVLPYSVADQSVYPKTR